MLYDNKLFVSIIVYLRFLLLFDWNHKTVRIKMKIII